MINEYETINTTQAKLNATHLYAKNAFKYEMIFKTRRTQIRIFTKQN